jgi:PhnB protein
MAGSVKPVPEGYHLVTPYLCIKGASEAIEFYKSAFDATELMRIPSPYGSIGHAEIQIGDSRIMISDESPEMGFRSPATIGGTPVHVYMYVEDVDRIFAQAIAAGATAMMPLWKTSSGATAPAPW